jgi:hypothetical protein
MVTRAGDVASNNGGTLTGTTAVLRLPKEKVEQLVRMFGKIPESAWKPDNSALPSQLPKGARLIPVTVMNEPMVEADPHAQAHLLVLSHERPADAKTVYFTSYSGGIIGINRSAGPFELNKSGEA